LEPWVIATSLIGVYLLVTLIIGVVANRRMTDDPEDFMLYGRKAGAFVLYLTVVATYHSAFAFLGSGGFFYTTESASGRPARGRSWSARSPTPTACGSGHWASASDT